MKRTNSNDCEPILIATNLPLHQGWERIAAKELALILSGVCAEGFDSPEQLAERLIELILILNPDRAV